MGLKLFAKKYKAYEGKELARRLAKKKRIAPYKALKNKKIPINIKKKLKSRKFNAKGFMKAINNPYK